MQEQILDALRGGDTATALDLARGHAAERPDDAEALRLLALALRTSGDRTGARDAITRAIALAPDDARLHLEHAGLLLGARDVAAAQEALQTAVVKDPNQFGAYILQAELALGRGDIDEAERLARLAGRVAPEHPTLMALEGTLALRRGRTEDAMKLLVAATERAPRDPVALHALAFAWLAKGHLAFAEQTFRNLLDLVPDATGVRLMVAQLQAQQGRPGDAADELAALLAAHPDAQPQVRRFAGELELAAGRPERALPLLRAALAALPGEPRTMAAIGETWRQLGAFEEARTTLDEAIAAHPDVDGLWRARLAFEPAGAGAAAMVARWRERRPESIDAMEAEMVLHASEGRPGDAEAMALRILEQAPGHVRAEMRVIDALLVRDPAAAVQRLEALKQRVGNNRDARVLDAWLGLARHRAGDYAEALAAWIHRNAADTQGRLPLPAATPTPGRWPEAAPVPTDAPPAAFLVGLPGSLVERAGALLEPVLPTFRPDRFGMNPPADAFQDLEAWPRIASGEVPAERVVASWRAALRDRNIEGAVIDWLPWWDNAYAVAMRTAMPEAVLLVMLRDPRDMLVDWLAFGARTPFQVESPDAAAAWLASALDQLATLHEQDLVRHHLIRVDETGEDPRAMAAQLGEALGGTLPEPPAGYFGAPRFAAGTWRSYTDLLAGPFAALAPVARRLGYPDA